jgi:hypothetical protein
MLGKIENYREKKFNNIKVRSTRENDKEMVRRYCLKHYQNDDVAKLSERTQDNLVSVILRHIKMLIVEEEENIIGYFIIGKNKALVLNPKRYEKKTRSIDYIVYKETGIQFEKILYTMIEYLKEYEKHGYNYCYEIDGDKKGIIENLTKNEFQKLDKNDISESEMKKVDKMVAKHGLENSFRKNDIYVRVI